MFNKSFEGTAGGGEYQRIKSRLLGLLALNLSHGDVRLLVGGGKSQIMQISWGKKGNWSWTDFERIAVYICPAFIPKGHCFKSVSLECDFNKV